MSLLTVLVLHTTSTTTTSQPLQCFTRLLASYMYRYGNSSSTQYAWRHFVPTGSYGSRGYSVPVRPAAPVSCGRFWAYMYTVPMQVACLVQSPYKKNKKTKKTGQNHQPTNQPTHLFTMDLPVFYLWRHVEWRTGRTVLPCMHACMALEYVLVLILASIEYSAKMSIK